MEVRSAPRMTSGRDFGEECACKFWSATRRGSRGVRFRASRSGDIQEPQRLAPSRSVHQDGPPPPTISQRSHHGGIRDGPPRRSAKRTSLVPEASRGGRPWGRPCPPRDRRRGNYSGADARTARSAINRTTIRASVITPRSCHASAKVPQRGPFVPDPILAERRHCGKGWSSPSVKSPIVSVQVVRPSDVPRVRLVGARCRARFPRTQP